MLHLGGHLGLFVLPEACVHQDLPVLVSLEILLEPGDGRHLLGRAHVRIL